MFLLKAKKIIVICVEFLLCVVFKEKSENILKQIDCFLILN